MDGIYNISILNFKLIDLNIDIHKLYVSILYKYFDFNILYM